MIKPCLAATLALMTLRTEYAAAAAIDATILATPTFDDTMFSNKRQAPLKAVNSSAISGGGTKGSQNDEEKRPVTALGLARALGISDDDSRPDDQLETTFLGKRLIIGGEIGTSVRARTNYALERDADDDDVSLSPELKLEGIWLPGDSTVVFVSGKAFLDADVYKQGGGAETQAGLDLDEAWLLQTGLFGSPLALQVGRQQIKDRREWWWDTELDSVRFHYFGTSLNAFVGIGREFGHKSTLGRPDPEQKGIVRAFANVKWDWSDRQQVELYALHHNDRSRRARIGDVLSSDDVDDSDARLTWAGLRVRGRVKTKLTGKFYYWGDIARVSGRENLSEYGTLDDARDIVTDVLQRTVKGWAVDVGASFELPFKPEPYLTLGYAWGSGDSNRGTGTNRAFRQTGLHNNNGKFRGLSRFRYYGEVLRPDLSNISISTVALGVPLRQDLWLESVWHRYRQPVAARRIAGSRLDINPDGIHRNLGDGFDLVLSHKPSVRWEFEAVLGGFRAGPAFDVEKGRWAGKAEIKINLNF